MFKPIEVGKYMTAEVTEVKPKTVVQTVRNKHYGTVLGKIHWYPQWRMYTFAKDGDEFSPSCLRALADFIERQTKAQKTFSLEQKENV